MPQLFLQDESKVWSVFGLTSNAYRLFVPPRTEPESAAPRSTDPLRLSIIESAGAERLSEAGALLLSRASGEGTQAAPQPPSSPEGWAVLAGVDSSLCINGLPVSVGIATLRHRDELCLEGGAPVYFSTERLVRIETYPREDSPRCPRCTLSVELNDTYVCCPGCGVLHHQLPDRECWTYTPTCTLCDQSSDLEAGYRWSPEVL